MDPNPSSNSAFLEELTTTMGRHLSEEQFGPSELAAEMNMSRSSLLRKLRKEADVSVSQFINQLRLEKARELLLENKLNVSEVALEVGFGSTSYFVKCYRERYGYPPGEEGRIQAKPESQEEPVTKKKLNGYYLGTLGLVLIIVSWLIFRPGKASPVQVVDKSVVVLPFINDSQDEENRYLIDGLMDATLSNLQKIKGLRVLSRTSSEKYRQHSLSAPEIAKELDVNYVVEGSGQKLGDRVVLNIQLIDGNTDKSLWSKQYRREVKDLFTLQEEIAKDIAEHIQVVLTPDENQRLSRPVTSNAQAYDLFMRGLGPLKAGGNDNLQKALSIFKEAIQVDKDFALAYACAGFACFYLDLYKQDKPYLEELAFFADQAMLNDPELAESYTAKALYYLQKKDYKEALPFLEKGLELSPNSSEITSLLADYYGTYMPNTGKYIQFALRAQRLTGTSSDSVAQSYAFMRIGNALVQTGFVGEAIDYLNKSKLYFPDNPYSNYILAFAEYPQSGDLKRTLRLLEEEFKKDSNRIDIIKDIGKINYYLRDFETAAINFDQFDAMRLKYNLDVYDHESLIIAKAYAEAGQQEKADHFLEVYKGFLSGDKSVYHELALAMLVCYEGKKEESLKHLEKFTSEDQIQYWVLLFLESDPIVDPIKNTKSFRKSLDQIKKNFWRNHEEIKSLLGEERLL